MCVLPGWFALTIIVAHLWHESDIEWMRVEGGGGRFLLAAWWQRRYNKTIPTRKNSNFSNLWAVCVFCVFITSSRYRAFDGRGIMSENVNKRKLNVIVLQLLLSYSLTCYLFECVCVCVLEIIRFSFGACDNNESVVYSYIVSISSRF